MKKIIIQLSTSVCRESFLHSAQDNIMLKTVVLIGLALANLLPGRVEPYSPHGIDRIDDDLKVRDGSGEQCEQCIVLFWHQDLHLPR